MLLAGGSDDSPLEPGDAFGRLFAGLQSGRLVGRIERPRKILFATLVVLGELGQGAAW
jgi:hypothetical protein